MAEEPTEVVSEQLTPTCYRHPGRETHIRCQRCNRPICPDCMRQAAVGFPCPDCVKEGSRTTRQGRTAYGGRRPTSPGAVTSTLIGINLVVFVMVIVTGGADGVVRWAFALIPVGGPAPVNGQVEFVKGVSDGAYWQLLTSMFTH